MVAVDSRPDAGGNYDQSDDGRDEHGRLPEPLDASRDVGEAIRLPGMPASQPPGTGPVVSSPAAAPVIEPDAPKDTEKGAAKPGPGLTTKNTPARPAK